MGRLRIVAIVKFIYNYVYISLFAFAYERTPRMRVDKYMTAFMCIIEQEKKIEGE